MTLNEVIIKNKLNQVDLAAILGITKGTFSEKVRGLRYSKFTENQKKDLLKAIKKYSDNLSKDINSVKYS